MPVSQLLHFWVISILAALSTQQCFYCWGHVVSTEAWNDCCGTWQPGHALKLVVKQAPNKTIRSVLSNRPNIHQNLSMSNKDRVSSVKSLISTVIFMRCAHKDSTQERSLVKIYLEYVFSVKMMLKAQENNDLQMSASCRNIASSFPRVCLHRFQGKTQLIGFIMISDEWSHSAARRQK